MSDCTKPIDPDLDDMRECGTDGQQCFDCRCAEYDYWRNLYNREKSQPTDVQYRQDMIDAGRAHLLADLMADRIDMARMREKDRS